MTPVLKLGGELLEDSGALRRTAGAIVELAARGPLVVVHGGGRAIDSELRARGVSPTFVDGVRVTDAPTLDVVVSVLGGRTNTALVAAVGAAGGRPVGLTGADGRIGLSSRSPEFQAVSGRRVDLGLVGQPVGTDATLLADLLSVGCIPIVASIGVTATGELLNVNADVLAAHLASVVRASRLIIAGTTVGVLDENGDTIPVLSLDEIETLRASGSAHSGMVVKLAACRDAVTNGVAEVLIVTGCDEIDFAQARGTRIVAGNTRAAELTT